MGEIPPVFSFIGDTSGFMGEILPVLWEILPVFSFIGYISGITGDTSNFVPYFRFHVGYF